MFIAMRPISSNPVSLAVQSAQQARAVFLLQQEPVSDHGDELAVGGLALGVAHRVPEVLLQGFRRVYCSVYSYKVLSFIGFL